MLHDIGDSTVGRHFQPNHVFIVTEKTGIPDTKQSTRNGACTLMEGCKPSLIQAAVRQLVSEQVLRVRRAHDAHHSRHGPSIGGTGEHRGGNILGSRSTPALWNVVVELNGFGCHISAGVDCRRPWRSRWRTSSPRK